MKHALFAFASAVCAIFVLAGIGAAQFNPNAPTPTMPAQPGLLAPQTGNTNIGIPSQNIPGGRDVTKTPEASDSGTKKKGLPGPSTAGRPGDGKGAGADVNSGAPGKLGGRDVSLPAGSQLPIDPDALIPPGFPQIKQLLDFLKDGPLTAGNLPGGPSGSDRPEFPKTTQPKGPKGGLPMTIGGAPAPFENPSGQASQDGGWVQTGKTKKTEDGYTKEWKHKKTGETKSTTVHNDSKDEGSSTTTTGNPRTGAGTTVYREQKRGKDGKLERYENTHEKRKTSEGWKTVVTERWYDMKGRETKSKQKVWMPNEGGGRSTGGIICFTELQCQAAMKKAQEEAKKLPGPGGMPTETAGTPSRGRGTVPGDATDPNPENLGGSGGGGGRSGPPIYCVGEDCERASGSGGGTPPVPGAPPG